MGKFVTVPNANGNGIPAGKPVPMSQPTNANVPVAAAVSLAVTPVKATSRASVPLFVKIMVFRKILVLNDGRDKLLKVLQYGSKAIIYLGLIERLLARSPALLDEKTGLKSRLTKLVSHLSMARKIVRLFHVLEPIQSLHDFNTKDLIRATGAKRTLAWSAFVGCFVGIVNDISDDIICFSKMGVLDKRWSSLCAPVSDRMWFASIFIDLHEILHDRIALKAKLDDNIARCRNADVGGKVDLAVLDAERKKICEKLAMHRLSLIKLAFDFTFCTFDVFSLGERGWDEGWQVFSGFGAAIMGTAKLYVKNR
ncbi:hypothetical protein HK101_011890 [Irineochytrium annulatum]|nr:hypothetical protein HK101_011890 [Irineochytrium annulatum]